MWDIAPFGRTREIEVVAHRQEVASLIKLDVVSTSFRLCLNAFPRLSGYKNLLSWSQTFAPAARAHCEKAYIVNQSIKNTRADGWGRRAIDAHVVCFTAL
jgi:hypothetical protein